MSRGRRVLLSALLATLLVPALPWAAEEPPVLREKVNTGQLPPLHLRLPQAPMVVRFDRPGTAIGRYGGELRMLMGGAKDTRMMVVYGYARLVGYDSDWNISADLLERIDVREGREFTLYLRPGHKWSDGHPFTAEDFRFYWEDVVNNAELSPGGPPRFLLVNGKPPRFEVIDETTVRYSWDQSNPFFLPALAGARPDYICAPAHYLKAFHPRYADAAEIKKQVDAEGQRGWTARFNKYSHQYQNDNPSLPTLQPWMLETKPPSSRLVFVRNPFYYRVDPDGRQLPYIDQVALTIVSPQLIPAKTAAGDADLQARGLTFENYTVLKQGEQRNPYTVRLWRSARGSEVALYPDLTAADGEWRQLLRQDDFRRALSLAINRREINQVVYYGLAREGNDTVLPESPLFEPEFETRWAQYDLAEANRLLDGLGLTRRNAAGIRLFAGGRPIEIVAETAGEAASQVAVVQLITESWRDIGVKLLVKIEQRDILRNRVFAGSALLSVWSGLENGLPNAETSPQELAPTSQQQLCWPKWGQHFETGGRSGEPVDLESALELQRLNSAWETTLDLAERRQIWQRMLSIRADHAFTLGTVRNVPQPVVISNRLRNVPKDGIYNWEPGAHFGVYRPDTFWFAETTTANRSN